MGKEFGDHCRFSKASVETPSEVDETISRAKPICRLDDCDIAESGNRISWFQETCPKELVTGTTLRLRDATSCKTCPPGWSKRSAARKTLEVSSSTGNASARCTSNRRRLSNGLTCHSDLSRDGANADSTVTGDLVVSGLVSAFTCITIVLRPTVSSFPSLSAVRVKLTFRTSRFEAVAFSGT